MSVNRRKNRFAGACKWCYSCIDNEYGICLLLMREVEGPHVLVDPKEKCCIYQPRPEVGEWEQ